MTAPVEDEQTLLLSHAVAAAVNPYADRFKRPAAEEASSKEESEEDDEDVDADDSA